MKKHIIFIVLVNIIFFGCIAFKSANKDKPLTVDIFEFLLSRTDPYRYNILQDKKTYLQYYGYDKDLKKQQGGCSLGGSSHIIYYQNPGNNYQIRNIIILGQYNGSLDRQFYFRILDFDNNILFTSANYSFGIFSSTDFVIREFPVDKIDLPGHFLVEVISNSDRDNGLFIGTTLSTTTYSVKYYNPRKYEELEYANWCIYVKYEKQ